MSNQLKAHPLITMRQIEHLSIPVLLKLTPDQIKSIRVATGLNRADFADKIGASKSTIDKWETGAKTPSGIALKMLYLIKDKGIAILD